MKNLIIIFCLVFVSCNSNKNIAESTSSSHSHDGQTAHSHDEQKDDNNYFESYTLKDENFGTNTTVTVKGNSRTMVTNALPNHQTGSFPNQGNPNTISAQKRAYTFPLNPTYTGKAEWIREPGVAINGVKFEPGTAEVVVCDTGENYRVEAFQDIIDLGLDFNHAHVQPTGAYHYHGTPTSVIESVDSEEDLVHIGFAQDGFPMYYSQSGAYKPSYKLLEGNREGEDCTYENPHNSMDISVGGHHDGAYGSDFEYVDGLGDLDECNGITIDGKYMYLVTNEFPYVSRCLMGEFEQDERQGPPRDQQLGTQNGRRSVSEIFKELDINEDGKLSKSEIKGPLADSFSKIDTNGDDLISKEELNNGIKTLGRKPRRD